MNQLAATLVASLICLLVVGTRAANALAKLTDRNLLDACDASTPAKELDETCRLLRFYNQTEVDDMELADVVKLADYCACELSRLPWEEAYHNGDTFQMLESMVSRKLKGLKPTQKHPRYLWSDLELLMNGVSVYHSMRDYFAKVRRDPSVALMSREEMDQDEVFCAVRYVCHRISTDRLQLYRYLENLERLNPLAAMKLIGLNEFVYTIYEASKACKLLIVHNLAAFRLYPASRRIIATGPVTSVKEVAEIESNAIDDGADSAGTSQPTSGTSEYDVEDERSNFTLTLRRPSIHLMNCRSWADQRRRQHHETKSLKELTAECPMFVSNQLPVEWVNRNPSSLDRTREAVKCGCQLLAHNATWTRLIKEKEIDILNKAITLHIDSAKFPNFGQTPLWSIYGWFAELTNKLARDKQKTIDIVVKYRIGNATRRERDNPRQHGTQFTDINKITSDSIETIRVACLKLLFSYNLDPELTDGLRPIKYLDNLRYVSKDPMFVFHLTLQDANLFKLHTMAKICEPFTV